MRDLRQRFDHIVRQTCYTFRERFRGGVTPFLSVVCQAQRSDLVRLMKAVGQRGARHQAAFERDAAEWMIRTLAIVLMIIDSGAERPSPDNEGTFHAFCQSVRNHLKNASVFRSAYPPQESLEVLWGRIWLNSSRTLGVPIVVPRGATYYVESGVPGARYALPRTSTEASDRSRVGQRQTSPPSGKGGRL